MKQSYLAALAASAMISASCSGTDGFVCGPGTRAAGRECLVAGGTGGAPLTPVAGASDGGSAGVDDGGSGGLAGRADAEAEAGEGGLPEPRGVVEIVSAPLECGSRDITGATVVTKPITTSTTWSGVVYLPQGLIVRNQPTLTIRPGTKIIVGAGATVEIGWQSSSPTIRALGTADNPISFCGETEDAGYWAGVIIRGSVNPNSVLRNVLISDAGGKDAGLSNETPIVMQGVQIRNSAATGLKTAGFGPESSTLIVSGSSGAPIMATAARGLDLPPNSSLIGNALDLIDIGFSTLDSSVTLRNFGIPYRQMDNVNGTKLTPAPVVTIEAGVVYNIKHFKLLDFGTAALHALGTSDKPIVFQGLPCPQDESYCKVFSQPVIDSEHAQGGRITITGAKDLQLDYVELRTMGWTKARDDNPNDIVPFGALTIATDSPLQLDHVKLTKAAGWGIQLSGSGSFTSGSGAIDVNTQPRFATSVPNPLALSCGFLMSLPLDTRVSGEPRTSVACYGTSTLAATWPVGAAPYILAGFTIEAGGSLTLQPGTVLRFLQKTTLRVQPGGSLRASGSATAPVSFVQDTTDPAAKGKWNGLIVEPGGSASLDYTVVDSAGASDNSNIVARGPLTLTNSTISNSAGWGLQKMASDDTDYVTSNLFPGNVNGAVTDLK